ncbi:MAG TPA: glycosyltransferase family 4 protein [Acidimicrobiia bacterium]|nr:glycosyltransferase family 4 protein [Acidimicrobiia bacterium]
MGAAAGAKGEARLRVMLSCPYSLSLVGGVQGQVLGLARSLRELGVDARVIAPCDGPPPMAGVVSVGPSTRIPSNGSVAPIASGRAVARRTFEALRSFSPDVLHLHEPFAPGANHAALVGTTLPAVGTFHSARSGRNGWYDTFRTGLRPMLKRLSVATAVSADAARQVELTFHTECEIVANGVDIGHYERAEPWPAPTHPAIMFVGRHEPRKGLAVLLDAFARLDRDATLWVVGEGPQTSELRRSAPAGVEWLGRVSEDEKARRLRAAAVACFPAIEGESFGVVLLEAMAGGTPVVASDIDGYRTVARDGAEALLVPPSDPEALAAALRRALDDRRTRDDLVTAGRARAAEFSMTHLAERFVKIYERAIESPRDERGRSLVAS